MWTILLLLIGTTQGRLLGPIVSAKVGQIKGLRAKDGNYSMYLGVPYGKVDEGNPFGKLFLIACFVAYVAADVSHILPHPGSERDAKILKQELDVGVEGQYQWAIETENGISAQARGALNNPQAENPAQVAQGQAQWTSPEGEVVSLQYTADENGYQVQGSHIPTPPPIPEAIAKALEFIRSHPPQVVPANRK
ncbi:unnamed protein product [Leptosia nina]|uniref:Uncharacterized protein n=1 Tax=Leptosia nina TaxID=320188 RepID=A0AAV1JXR0_9NEOP